jgi:hypothetical protein
LMHGRHAEAMASNQEGYDIESYDEPAESPSRRLVRRIEVKGKGTSWDNDEVVTMSLPQFSYALKHQPEVAGWDYWLYVVERNAQGGFTVLPIWNPAKRVVGFDLRGGTWRWTVVEN